MTTCHQPVIFCPGWSPAFITLSASSKRLLFALYLQFNTHPPLTTSGPVKSKAYCVIKWSVYLTKAATQVTHLQSTKCLHLPNAKACSWSKRYILIKCQVNATCCFQAQPLFIPGFCLCWMCAFVNIHCMHHLHRLIVCVGLKRCPSGRLVLLVGDVLLCPFTLQSLIFFHFLHNLWGSMLDSKGFGLVVISPTIAWG